ncbi:hypothetical protein BESB_051740 [Besnoitia besnoiti]|uniref:Uncharacterized protein n=1 Tax=Besnoitia besnoiti TaxID=94643 RepID=A0A2A9MIQ6_BESBE|nr:hypothetical protein BESB_051740 [Besnoitia besnoiti]PFH35523.1 hypothetical protein BESB_051740 [Besnoitia besnoiti]
MRSVFFFGTFLMGLRATSASSALDGSAAGSEGDLQRLQASADLNDIQPESSDALEKLQEAQRASQAFAHRNLPGSHIGNGVIPYDGNANEDSYGGDDVSAGRALGKRSDFLAPSPAAKKVIVQVPEKKATPVTVYRKLQEGSDDEKHEQSENDHQGGSSEDLDREGADDNREASDEEDLLDALRRDNPEASEDQGTVNEDAGSEDTQSALLEGDDPEREAENEEENALLAIIEIETDLEVPDEVLDESESEDDRRLGKKSYYYAPPKKALPPPKRVAVAPKKALPVKAPPKKVHEKKVVPTPQKAVLPAKKAIPVQKKAPPPKKVYAPPPKKVYAPPPKKVYAPPPKKVYAPPPKKVYAPPPKKVYAPKKYVPVSKKGGY